MNGIDIAKIDLNLLKSFQALIKERHVGRAATKMNVSQSAMSHSLSRLRKAFDDELFTRTARGMEPSARALEIGQKLTTILDQVDALFVADEFDPKAVNKRFRIQTHSYIAATYMPVLLAKIQRISPHLVFDLQSINQASYEQLDSGKTDMIIGAGLDARERFGQALFIEDELLCLLDKRHPALQEWTAENIFNYPHVKLTLLEDHNDPVTIYGHKNGFAQRQIGLYTETLHIQSAFLAGTELIAFIPATLARQAAVNNSLKIMACPFKLPTLQVKGIWNSRHENDVVHSWIRSQLLQAS